ncbi:hypothetical protein B0J11DRAFT_501524 [Dendryphion nanum]|uniref:Uncharacterized protein n=1 Tax=Dendryphion nanum TaxID=256645 RepID=A0A9P9IZA0_9PLEO|nr:hypothetical protein B0J11DRAFT_501524 [Dendryphion nanum]
MASSKFPSWAFAVPFFLILFTGPVTAHHKVTFMNHCTYPLYFWQVLPNVHPSDDTATYVAPGDSLLHHMPPGISTSIKMRDLPNYEVAPAGITQFEYFVDGFRLWYDLSYIDCNQTGGPTDPMYCPFAAGGVKLSTSDPHCPVAVCQLGGTCEQTYLIEGGWKDEPSLSCPIGTDLVVELCSHGFGQQSNPHGETLPPVLPPENTPPEKEQPPQHIPPEVLLPEDPIPEDPSPDVASPETPYGPYFKPGDFITPGFSPDFVPPDYDPSHNTETEAGGEWWPIRDPMNPETQGHCDHDAEAFKDAHGHPRLFRIVPVEA